MSHNPRYKYFVISVLILLVGMGLSLALPWLVGARGIADQSEDWIHVSSPQETRYHVARTGSGLGGLSWTDAFTNVQDALNLANIGGGGEIWVAAGVYYPDEGTYQVDNSRTSNFQLLNNVKVYGGFDNDDTQFSERDWENKVTVLSGDIDGNDTTDINKIVLEPDDIKGDNAYHVVSAMGATGTTVLNGFTITAGKADGSNSHSSGGGFYCDGSAGGTCSPSIVNVNFRGNFAYSGGGLFNDGNKGTSSPVLINVNFHNNSALFSGGAIYNNGMEGSSSPIMKDALITGNITVMHGGAMYNNGTNKGNCNPNLKNVTFSGNVAGDSGGGMYNNGSDNGNSHPLLKKVEFSSNSANRHGGAMYNDGGENGSSRPYLENVTFTGNIAFQSGGAIYNNGEEDGDSSPGLINVVFSGNFAGEFGGALYNSGRASGTSNPTLTNVTFSGNSADLYGGGMFNDGKNGASHPIVGNSIFWNNQDSIGTGTLMAGILNNLAMTTLSNSLLQGTGGSSDWNVDNSYSDAGGNIDTDPEFVTPVNPSGAPTTSGNLRLGENSPAINSGDNSLVTASKDLDGNERIFGGIVDMGAYEYQIPYIYDISLPIIIR